MGNRKDTSDLGELLARTASGDRKAFRSLYLATSRRLFAVLIRLMGNEADASDVLQDVYIAVWNRAGRFDPERGTAISWLAVIARNAGIDALRRRRPEHVGEEYCDLTEFTEPTPFDTMLTGDVAKELALKIRRLPESQRYAVRLFYLEENSLVEVSEKMKAPLNTVKSWVRRGIANLRDDFEETSICDYI